MRRERPPNGPLDPRYEGPTLTPKLYEAPRSVNMPPEPSKEEFMQAFFGKPAPQGDNETQGNIFTIIAGGPPAVVQSSTLTGNGIIRVQIADQDTVNVLSNGLGQPWQVECVYSEGWRGAAFNSPIDQRPAIPSAKILIPVKGKSIAVHGNLVKALVYNRNAPGTPDFKISLAIIPERAVDDTAYQESATGFLVSIFENSHHFSVTPNGGVIMGDTIEVSKYNGVLSKVYPALSGGVYALGREDAFVEYVPAGAATSCIYTFYRTL